MSLYFSFFGFVELQLIFLILFSIWSIFLPFFQLHVNFYLAVPHFRTDFPLVLESVKVDSRWIGILIGKHGYKTKGEGYIAGSSFHRRWCGGAQAAGQLPRKCPPQISLKMVCVCLSLNGRSKARHNGADKPDEYTVYTMYSLCLGLGSSPMG